MTEDNDGTKKEGSSFAPHNPTDGRKVGEWKSRYDSDAWLKIWFECAYLGILFFLSLIILYIVWEGYLNNILHLPIKDYISLKIYIYASIGGLFGGTLNGMKWLYHSIAKGIWNYDRRAWRIITPILSCGLALVIVALIRSEFISAFNPESVKSGSASFSIGFLVGFFSDTAVAKLAEIAQTLFGVSSKLSK